MPQIQYFVANFEAHVLYSWWGQISHHGCEITTQHAYEVRAEMARAVKGVEHAAKVAAERPLFWLHI